MIIIRWFYKPIGSNDDACRISVTHLQRCMIVKLMERQTYGEKSILSPAVNSIRFDKGQVLSSEIGGLRKRETTDLF